MQALLLQKPYAKSKSKDHMLHLSRRLSLWKNGCISELLHEGRSIQKRFVNTGRKQDDEQTARIFSKLMMEGKALRFVSDISKGGEHSLDQTVPDNGPLQVRDVLRSKHPSAKTIQENSLLYGPIDSIDPVIFDAIDGSLIHTAALRISGAAGPSGLDANGWKRLCSS